MSRTTSTQKKDREGASGEGKQGSGSRGKSCFLVTLHVNNRRRSSYEHGKAVLNLISFSKLRKINSALKRVTAEHQDQIPL